MVIGRCRDRGREAKVMRIRLLFYNDHMMILIFFLRQMRIFEDEEKEGLRTVVISV